MALDQDFLDRVLNSPRLPSLPTIALEIIDLVQQDEVDIDRIADTIIMDPALSSKILKTVNSSFYGQAKTVSSINQAVVVLGLNSVKTLALGFSLVNNLTQAGGEGFDHLNFWKRSLFGAAAAKHICDFAGFVQAEEVFMCALMQDVGVLAMHQVLGKEYAGVQAKSDGNHSSLAEHEHKAFGGDHAEVGGALADSWGLPPVLAMPIRFHEAPDEAPENLRPLVQAVAAGARCADVLMDPEDASKIEACKACLSDWFGVDTEKYDAFLKEIHQQTREFQRLFALPTGDLGSADEIMAQANQALESISLKTVQQVEKLVKTNAGLEEAVNTDALTGVSNRRALSERMGAAFARADMASPMSVMFLDIDHFKQFNDTHGHDLGDRVLAEFAKTLTESAGAQGEVFRYGGEEFAILFPGTDRKTAALIAEQIRKDVDEKLRVEGKDGESHNVTTSIGVATCDGTSFKSAGQALKAADQGVYAAKNAGRNCVRVFVPRAKKSDAA